MALPEHVKRLAMDAVSHKETTDMIRAFKGSGMDVSPAKLFTHTQPPSTEIQPLTEGVKQQAKDAIAHLETQSQIRLVKDNGEIVTQLTPNRTTQRIAHQVAELHQSGQDLDQTHRQITQDGFGR